jgi:hypothetical protein
MCSNDGAEERWLAPPSNCYPRVPNRAPGTTNHLQMMERMDVPRDPVDDRYVISFALSETEEAVQFFDKFGFVVWSNIFTAEECLRSRQAMWDGLASQCPGISADDPLTWGLFKSNGLGVLPLV